MTNDELNTWRTLKDQLPLVTSFWCRLGLHSWTKWDEPYKYGSYYYQIKECIHCNSKKRKDLDSVTGAICSNK